MLDRLITRIALSSVLGLGVAGAEPVGWRSNGESAFPEAAPPLHWSATSNVVWKTKLPKWSNASPILVGQRVFVCAEPDTLLCLDKKTGAILWQKENPHPDGNVKPRTHGETGFSSPTPVSDGSKTVYALFGNGMAAAYDLSGNRKWFVPAGLPRHNWGHSASPLLVGDRLFVVVEDEARALKVSDGSTLWKAGAVQSWGSPVLLPGKGDDLVFTAGGQAYSLATGDVVATLPKLDYNSAVVAGGRLFCIQGESKAYDMERQPGAAPALKEAWSAVIAKDRYYASPVVLDGLVYALMKNGMFFVLDARTGEQKWEKHLPLGGTCYPSIVTAGGYIFLSSDTGKTIVYKPGELPELVATNELERFRSTPVFEGTRMYVRGLEHLYCIGR